MLEREAIYQRVWGYAMAHGDRSVDVFIRKLRQKLEKRSPGWSYIHTHFGVGYRFDPEPAGRRGRRAGAEPVTEPVAPTRGAATRGGAEQRPSVHQPFTTASPPDNRSRAPAPTCSAAMSVENGSRSSDLAGRLEIRPEEHAALVDGRPLSLTVRELQLLSTLAAHPQRIMTREELYAEVWGGAAAPRRPLGRRLRQPPALEARRRAAGADLIHTHNGIGYRFSPDG